MPKCISLIHRWLRGNIRGHATTTCLFAGDWDVLSSPKRDSGYVWRGTLRTSVLVGNWMNKQRRLPTGAQDIILPHNRMLRNRGDQSAGVLVLWIAEHFLHTCALYNLPLM